MLFKKFLLAATIAAGMTISCSALAFADGITVKIGNDVLTTDQPPVVVDGRTLVPFRAIYEGLGAEVEWNDQTREVTGTRGQTTVKMTIDNPEMQVNGNTVALDVPAKIIGGRTMVPVRAVSDGLDETINWDPSTKTVTVNSSYIGINTTDKPLLNPGWLDEAGLPYMNGYDPENPYYMSSQIFDLDANGNQIWKDEEAAFVTDITNVTEGQAAKNIAVEQGVLDVEKMEKKVKDTFGSAKWISIEWSMNPIVEFEGYYPSVWSCGDADIDLRKSEGEVDHLNENQSYIDLCPIRYNGELYDIASTTKDTVMAVCVPEDYDNLLFWISRQREAGYNNQQALYADILSPGTDDNYVKIALWLPLKK